MGEGCYLLRFDFESPLHIGEPGIGMERSLSYIPSDTLFSAVCNAWAILYGKSSLEKLINTFQYETPFCFSSGFPRLHIEGDSQITEMYYLPEPLSRKLRRLPTLSSDREKVKGLYEEVGKRAKYDTKTYIDLESFCQLVTLPTLDMEYYERLKTTSKLLSLVYHKSLHPRGSLDRMGSESNPFFCQSIAFGRGKFSENGRKLQVRGGLYSILKVDSEGIATKLRSCLNLLGVQGIGGERSVGCGSFKCNGWDREQMLFPKLDRPEGFVTLSLYHPSPEERRRIKEDGELIGYQLVKRGGWIDSPFITRQQQKKSCFMFEEGSVFGFEPRGEVFDVTPVDEPTIHRIYRCGLAFTVGVKLWNA